MVSLQNQNDRDVPKINRIAPAGSLLAALFTPEAKPANYYSLHRSDALSPTINGNALIDENSDAAPAKIDKSQLNVR